MRSSLSARRKSRKVGHDEDDPGGRDMLVSAGTAREQETTPTVIRPASKSKKRSSLLRTSFGTGDTSMNDDDESGTNAVFTPKKSTLSRQAIEKNALKKSLAPSISGDHPLRQSEDRPSYSADHLNELRTSTPSTPKDLRAQTDSSAFSESKELDLAAKFGSDLALQHDSAIPTDAEMKEKKARRARLALENEFINLDSDNQGEDDENEDSDADSNDETSVLPYASKPQKQPSTRLTHDDEDIAEGFDQFVSDGRIALGRKAEREQKRKQKAEMREMINEAEGGDSDDTSEDESEVERRAAYEAAQTRKGMEGLRTTDEGAKRKRPRTPPRITPLPSLGGVLERLKEQKAAKELSRQRNERRSEEVRKELEDIEIRKVELQRLVDESGERFQEMRRVLEEGQKREEDDEAEKGMGNAGLGVGGERAGLGMGMGMAQRGLESLGNG